MDSKVELFAATEASTSWEGSILRMPVQAIGSESLEERGAKRFDLDGGP